MALPARPEKSTSGSATRAGGMSNLTHKQEEGAERPRAATKGATRKYSGGQHAQVQSTWPQCGF
eukprot:7359337-Prymnesium_polylepis.1